MDLVLIPAYEPDESLIELCKQLSDEGFEVLVVDDGSGEKYADIFSSASQNAQVIAHKVNRGKGAALKTGMRYIRDNIPECEGFITCDADGQHKVEDVVRVRERLHKGDKFVLTVRNKRRDIPFRSKIGNDMSRVVYALLSNRYLSDNQSGLRGFSRVYLDWLIEVEKDNYDYEMNVLYYAAKKGIKVSTIPIEAIYIGNNESSHFNPIGDTVKIYKSLFWLSRGTFFAFVMSEILVLAVSIIFGYKYINFTIPSVGAICYFISFILNKYVVFRKTACYDYLATLIYTVIWYFVYTMGSILIMYTFECFSLWAAFNLVYLICLPLRYFLHKFTFIASKTKE